MTQGFMRMEIWGNLTRDPEMRYTPDGTAMTTFGIAVNRVYAKKDRVDFMDVTAFRQTAEFANQYLNKGDTVFVRGDYYEDKGDKDPARTFRKVSIGFTGELKIVRKKSDVSAGETTDLDGMPF